MDNERPRYYCRMLLARLRNYDKFQLEILLPTDIKEYVQKPLMKWSKPCLLELEAGKPKKTIFT